jgi:hypothetical protein
MGRTTDVEQEKTLTPTSFADNTPGALNFSGKFCITGEFAFGSREDVKQQIEALGGSIIAMPSKGSILVLGRWTSNGWIGGNRGHKIEEALYKRKQGGKLLIVTEDEWARQVADCILRLEKTGMLNDVLTIQKELVKIQEQHAELNSLARDLRSRLAKIVSAG